MRRLRTVRHWIAALVGLALSVHIVAMAFAHTSAAVLRAPEDISAGYVDPILGATALCSSAASHGEPEDGSTSASGLCLFCHRDVALATAAQTLTWSQLLVASSKLRDFAPTGVPTVAEHLLRGGIRGRAPPASGLGLA